MGAVSGMNTAAMTLVATNTPEAHIGHSIGMIQTGFMAGSLAGPALGAVVAEAFGYRGSFIFSGIMIMLLVPLVLFGVQENFVPVQTDAKTEKKKEAKKLDFKIVKKHHRLLSFMVIILAAQFCIQGNDTFIPLYIQEIYEGQGINFVVALAFGSSAGVAMLTTSRLGRLGDTKGNEKIITVCLLGLGLCIFLQSLLSNIFLAIFLRLMAGFFIGGIVPNCYAVISKFTPTEARGSVLGMTTSFSALGNFAGPLVCGAIVANSGIFFVFKVVGLVLLFCALQNIIYLKYFAGNRPNS